jgi:L-aspartate oxidase
MRNESVRATRSEVVPSTSGISTARLEEIRDITWRSAGIVRNAAELKKGLKLLSRIKGESNLLAVARIIHECALAREESRGAHYREDFPETAATRLHSYVKKGQNARLA